MRESWLQKGSSDPVSFVCTCSAFSSANGGLVLLFYRYFSAHPPLPPSCDTLADDPSSLAEFQSAVAKKYNLGGKIRVAKEGFNITIGGTRGDIRDYIEECLSHWSFSGLDLDTEDKQQSFFKPTAGGCACVFGGPPASVRVAAEITPMGVTNYLPKRWDAIESLTPKEFHERCHADHKTLLLDVRNHYESRIGYFVNPKTGEAALRPPIRRFSQWPQYVKKYMTGTEDGESAEGRQIMAYCTGGIRCEKGVRWMEENMAKREGDRICTLKGGIAAYLTWIDEEIKGGRKTSEDSLFRGKNYVFDARGSTGLSEPTSTEPVSKCHMCYTPCDRLSKCRSSGCHLVLVVCNECEMMNPRCCESCHEIEDLAFRTDEINKPRPLCACERDREEQLWGAPTPKTAKLQGWRKGRKLNGGGISGINIQVKTIQ